MLQTTVHHINMAVYDTTHYTPLVAGNESVGRRRSRQCIAC